MRILGSIKMRVTHLNRFSVLLWGGVILCCCAGASGQVNSWTKRSSGQWHQPFWSAGERPSSTSHVLFTNAGWKALAVNNVTARNFPGSLSISNLDVTAPTRSFNTFMLNHVGVDTPFRVAQNLRLGSNSALLTLKSALSVGNEFLVDGMVIHEDSLLTSSRLLHVGNAASGRYIFNSGHIRAQWLVIGRSCAYTVEMPAPGVFEQLGGSNYSFGLGIANGAYILRDGQLATGSTSVSGTNAVFIQSGGAHTVRYGSAWLRVEGYEDWQRRLVSWATYRLSNGSLLSHVVRLHNAEFSQSGGTNRVSGTLLLSHDASTRRTSYQLFAGNLITTTSRVYGAGSAVIVQSGGSHIIAEKLELDPPYDTHAVVSEDLGVRYRLQGGNLSAREIRVSTNSIFRHTAGAIMGSPTLTLAGGIWESAAGQHQFGSLKLIASTRDSTLLLPESSVTLQFSHVPPFSFYWDAWARFVVQNWRGSAAGGGAHQIVFGTNGSGLTPPQLARIRFYNPVGFPEGEYAATLLDTGEIVPLAPTGRAPSITYQQTSSRLQLTWPLGYTLQTATNIAGPFADVNTNSPYTLDTTAEPQRFFRFRQ